MQFQNPSELLTFIQEKLGPETPRRMAAFAADILWREGLVLMGEGQNWPMVLDDSISEEKWAAVKKEAGEAMSTWTWLKIEQKEKEDVGD